MADTCGVADLKERVIILKMVQIPDSLFVALVKFHVLGIEDCLPEIKNGLEQKLDAMMRRELYKKQKRLRQKQKGKRLDRRILIRLACTGISGGDFFLHIFCKAEMYQHSQSEGAA